MKLQSLSDRLASADNDKQISAFIDWTMRLVISQNIGTQTSYKFHAAKGEALTGLATTDPTKRITLAQAETIVLNSLQ